MKSLYINNKQLVLDGDTQFPFSYKISDLENVDIINFPVSKTIQIPRCSTNDEIFGYIADITRTNIGFNDNLVAVSFNQIKKATYTLLNGSEVVSSGLLVLNNILNDVYECTLYDKTIEILTDITGDEDLDTGFLNNLNIIDDTNAVWERQIKSNGLNYLPFLMPTFNITDSDLTGTDVLCKNASDVTVPQTLEAELTPLQFRTFKCWDVDMTMPIKYVIKSINQTHNNLISYDTFLNKLFSDVYLNLGKPKVKPVRENFSIDPQNFDTITATAKSTDFKDYTLSPVTVNKPCNTVSVPTIKKNGKYYIELNLNHRLESSYSATPLFACVYNGVRKDFSALVNGQKFGEIFVSVSLIGVAGGVQFESKKSKVKIELIYGVNTIIEYVGTNLCQVILTNMIPLTFDFYPQFRPEDVIATHIKIDYTDYCETTTMFAMPSGFPGYFMRNHTIKTEMAISDVEYITTEFRTGDILKGSTVFPRISIKDFIIAVAKYFNLDLVIKDSKLHIQYKKYYITNDIPIIDKIEEINTKTFEFSRMIMSNGLPTNTSLDDYTKFNGKNYTDKIINTGYSVKKTVKKLEFDVAVPILMRDVSAYGYDRFTKYYNGGYNRNLNGVTNGLDDKITFSFINRIDDDIWVTNDSLYEGNMYSPDTEVIPTEVKWIHRSECLKYDGTDYIYTKSNIGNTIYKSFYYTQSPYKWDDITIIQSLEMNKPLYSFANIADINYPEDVTHYSIYFKNMIEDKFNSNTHILKTKMLIDNFNQYSIYNVGNSNYIISNLDEYDPTIIDVYDVYLMKVNDTSKYISPIGTWGLPIELIETSTNYKGDWDFYGSYVYGDVVKYNSVYYTGKMNASLNNKRPDIYTGSWRSMY